MSPWPKCYTDIRQRSLSLPKNNVVMLTAIQGTYDHGQIILDEVPSVQKRTKVIVTFLEEETVIINADKRERQGGSMKGEVWMADNFNEPLDDLKEYM